MSQVTRSYGQRRLRKTTLTLVSLTFLIGNIFNVASAHARHRSSDGHSIRRVVLTVNKSRTIRADRPFRTATVGSNDIVDVKPMANNLIYVRGKKIGTTNISLYDDAMQLTTIFDVDVEVDTRSLQHNIRMITGSNSIRVSASNGQVVLSGMAANAVDADRAVSMAKSIVKSDAIINAINVAPSQQVMLKVRFLEAARSAERDLGINWFGTNAKGTRGVSTGLGTPITIPGSPTAGGISLIKSAGTLMSAGGAAPFGVVLANLVNGGTNIDVLISALENKGLIRRLAEPDLVALSGDTARFLAGGEFPVPVAVATTTGAGITPTIQFKKFGVSLSFNPTVLNRGLINLRIAPEVSELDYSNVVTISGTTIPSLVTRNAQTTVELRDGQSFAIAGLLQSTNVRSINQMPWLGTVPVLGALFRSASYQKKESDLVIIVTPHLVRPGTPIDNLTTPLDQRLSSNDTDFFVNGQTDVPKRYSDYVTSGGGIHGPYGYILTSEHNTDRAEFKGNAAK